jgi:3-phenylpropionate/trans-cinnamate dioxygenase ferredoxin reductase component
MTGGADAGVVIIGAGQAALECAASLRKGGYAGSIVMLGEEPHLPYQRPPLSKAYLLGDMDAPRLLFRNLDYFEANNIVLTTSAHVDEIDRESLTVTDEQGLVYHYTDLVIATGARVRPLPVQGSDLAGVYYLRTLDDVDRIEAAMAGVQNVAVIGAGFIGLEFAAVANKLGKTVTVIEAADRVMGRAVSEEISRYFEELHRSHGVTVMTGTGVAALEGVNGKLDGVLLANGDVVKTELALVGIGVIPNTELAQASGLECNNGIVVDELGRTSDPNIYAAGDCVVYAHPFAGVPVRLESVQNAIDQAKAVASAICGMPTAYHAIPWFWSDQYDIKLQMAGLTMGTDTHILRGSMADNKFSIFHFRDGVLRGVDSVNKAADHVMARKLLAAGISPTLEQAADDGFALKSLVS